MSLEVLDQRLKEREKKARRNYLIKQLHNLEIYYNKDGYELHELSLYELELVHLMEKNKFAKAYGEGE